MKPEIAAQQASAPMLRRKTTTAKRVVTAAIRILRNEGYAKMTMERVAAASRVAKTTLYRRWPTKAALCMEVYFEVAGRELADPDAGNVADDLKQILKTVVHLQTKTVAGQAFIGLIAESHLKPDFQNDFLAEFAIRRREVTSHVLRRAIQRGEILPKTDIDLVIDAIGGATTFRLLQRHAPLTVGFANSIVGLVLSGCKTYPPKGEQASVA
jgi:AcrR family transcriptional regulator